MLQDFTIWPRASGREREHNTFSTLEMKRYIRLKKLDCGSRMPIKWDMNVFIERRNMDCFGPML